MYHMANLAESRRMRQQSSLRVLLWNFDCNLGVNEEYNYKLIA